ncbi:unnamed protein product [Lactuca saligna]|uniref:Uncharacterized protein n=1 Tax=Lactuca saligna TaxID=75948 RepID=A0AA35VIH7_LACSI|nr:unnamed protein product [Lactuca saligna]
MNLDEFLKNVWSTEANQRINNGSSSDYSEVIQLASTSSLPRQLSLTFTKDLTKNIVDEVLQDMQQDQKKKKTNCSESNINNTSSCKRQATLGEMTLEDFLVKERIVSESSSLGKKTHEQNLDPPEV